jgi:hypothetical protein
MELKLDLNYPQILNLVRQLPVNQIAKLLVDAQSILEEEKKSETVASFQAFLLTAPVMSDEQYDSFLENRKMFAQWRMG